jgi:hypothetical protein
MKPCVEVAAALRMASVSSWMPDWAQALQDQSPTAVSLQYAAALR